MKIKHNSSEFKNIFKRAQRKIYDLKKKENKSTKSSKLELSFPDLETKTNHDLKPNKKIKKQIKSKFKIKTRR